MSKPLEIRRKLVFLYVSLWSLILANPLASQSVPKRMALIVGVNEYKDLSLGNLKTAKNDALGLTKILFSYGSYQKIEALVAEGSKEFTPNRLNILSHFDSLLEETGSEDLFIFYFSGHGIIDYNDKVYLLPEDADPSRPFETGISVESLIAKTREKNLKRVVFLIDACRNPQDGRGEEGKNFLQSVSFKDTEVISIFYSSKLGSPSFEDQKSGYGIFTKYLIYGLEGRADANFNGEVSYSELTTYVIFSLKDWSKENQKSQRPYTKEYTEKSEDVILTYAINPKTSLADAPLFNPYNPTYAFRSFLLPGWGQYVRGQEEKGKYFMSAFTVGLLHAGFRYHNYRNAANAYESAVGIPPNPRVGETVLANYLLIEPYRRDLERARSQFSLSLGILAAIWVTNVFDFYLLGPQPKEKIVWEMGVEPVGLLGLDQKVKVAYEIRY